MTPPLRALAPSILLLLSSCAAVERGRGLPVHPQRPTFSNDAFTSASGTLEVEAGVAWDPSDRLGTPVLARLGLDARSELLLGIEPVVLIGGGSEQGIGDLVVGYKRRVSEADGSEPALAWQARMKAPTADEDDGIGSGETDFFGALAATWPDEQYSVNAFLQFGLIGDPGGGTAWQTAGSFTVGAPVEEDVAGFGEVAVSVIPEFDDEQVFGIVGVQWERAPGQVFDLGFEVGLSEDAPDFQVYFGTTTNLGRLSE